MKIKESADELEHNAAKKELLALLLEEEGFDVRKTPVIERRKGSAAPPLSFAQQRLWFLDQLEPGRSDYNIPVGYRLHGLLDVTALEQSLNEIVGRHEVLRTSFTTVDDEPVQVISAAASARLAVVELEDLAGPEAEREVERLVSAEAGHAFDLSKGPLIRATLFRLAEADHVFLLTLHHIVADGWSMDVLFGELSRLYEAFSLGKPVSLPELPIQYADYAVWQRQCLQGEDLETQLGYWRQQLANVPPVLELPTDHPRLTEQTHAGRKKSLSLSKQLTEGLKALSLSENVTLFMTLLIAFKVLLYRYTGQDDIVVGTPVASRNREEIEGLIGFFVNTLVLRTDLSGEPVFRDLLKRGSKTCLEAYAHQDLPFEKLVEELQPERDLSRSPLFQVMFALQNVPRQEVQLTGLSTSPMEIDTEAAKFDLSLFMWEATDGIKGVLEYNTDLFKKETIIRMIGHFQILLESIVTNPDQLISRISLLTAAERNFLLEGCNKSPKKPSEGALLHERFEQQVEKTPEAEAVYFEGQILTYRELNCRVNQLAHYLQKLGVGPEVLVGLFMERSIEAVIGFLGILKAGGACVPLDASYPEDRIGFMLKDAQVPIILTQEKLLKRLPTHHATVFSIDSEWELIAHEREEFVVNALVEGNLSYVFYTSGSTGKPKAVLLTHRRSNKDPSNSAASIQVTEVDRHILKSPVGFTSFSAEITWPLLSGAPMVIIPPGEERNIKFLVDIMVEQNITFILVVPSMLRMLLEEPKFDQCRSLKQIACFGEPLPPELRDRLFARLDVDLTVIYGSTEGPSATSRKYQPNDLQHKVNIGRPLPEKLIYILDSNLEPVPIGVIGEMYIGGSLARGYLNRPELTAERFIPNPYSKIPGERMYKTGDLGKYLADGTIEFAGRRDFQTNIHGFRIELGEIETGLAKHPNVKEAVVLVNENKSGIKRLIAYVVLKGEAKLNSTELRRFLQKQMPDYMIPSIFVVLETIPLNPHGKIDRDSLPEPGNERFELETPFVAPRTPVEEVLAGIWSEVLGIERVGIYDNFFDLGGHSLLATRIVSRVNEFFQVQLPLRSLFESPTIGGLVNAIAEICGGSETLDKRVSQLVRELEQFSEDNAE